MQLNCKYIRINLECFEIGIFNKCIHGLYAETYENHLEKIYEIILLSFYVEACNIIQEPCF